MRRLEEYIKKRDFKKTPEPTGGTSKSENLIFVVQKHAASKLHYDLRLEHDGVLLSWAIPKGPSFNPRDKRLAVQTEDHPLDYADFEGEIPEGEYGAGRMVIWDRGGYVNITEKQDAIQPTEIALEKGHFLFWVKGKKLNGGFALQRLEGKNWILVKMDDEFAIQKPGRVEYTNPQKKLFPDFTKKDLLDYYEGISKRMLPHVIDRPLSLLRFPHGAEDNRRFFQKNMPEFFPEWFHRIKVESKGGSTTYPVLESEESIQFIANQVGEFHVWTSRYDDLDSPDKMVFDLDPQRDDIKLLRETAQNLRKFLEHLKFHTYLMTSGGKGFHVVVPLERDSTHDEVRAFAGKIAEAMAEQFPDLTSEFSKTKREGRLLIDVNRNSYTQTSIAPYSVRANPQAAIAAPIEWSELKEATPKMYTLKDAQELRKRPDPWKDFFENPRSAYKIAKDLDL